MPWIFSRFDILGFALKFRVTAFQGGSNAIHLENGRGFSG
jgi:hypothetical protein